MALIPVIFNADDNANTLKGKVTPENLSSFLGVLQSRQAGILDLFENPIGVTTIVDNTPVGKSTITFREGYVSIQGRLIYVQPNTQCQFSLPVAGTESGSFGIQIDLASTGANEVTWFKSTSTLRTDNIISNSATGVYQFRLYDYTATTTSLTLTNKTTEVVSKLSDFLQGDNFVTKPLGTKDKSIATTEFVNNEITNLIGFSKKSYQNNAIGRVSGKTTRHTFTVLDFLDTRLIYGKIDVLEANQITDVSWGSDLLKTETLNTTIFVPSFTTQERGNPEDRGMDEPCYCMHFNERGFVMYNSNGFTVTGTYIVIGQKP